jgi:hypothetical protein
MSSDAQTFQKSKRKEVETIIWFISFCSSPQSKEVTAGRAAKDLTKSMRRKQTPIPFHRNQSILLTAEISHKSSIFAAERERKTNNWARNFFSTKTIVIYKGTNEKTSLGFQFFWPKKKHRATRLLVHSERFQRHTPRFSPPIHHWISKSQNPHSHTTIPPPPHTHTPRRSHTHTHLRDADLVSKTSAILCFVVHERNKKSFENPKVSTRPLCW